MTHKRIIGTETRYPDPPGPPCRTAAEMEQICCHAVKELPCCERVTSWAGYDKEEVRKKHDFPEDWEIRYVARRNPCGKHVIKYDLDPKDCCDEVPPLEHDAEKSATVISPDGSAGVAVLAGKLPITWEVRGSGFYTDQARQHKGAVTTGRRLIVYAKDACGAGMVTAMDGCSEVSFVLLSTGGVWELVSVCRDSTGACSYAGWESEQNFTVQQGKHRYGYKTSVSCFDKFHNDGGECGTIVLGDLEGPIDGDPSCVVTFVNNPLCEAQCVNCIKSLHHYVWSC